MLDTLIQRCANCNEVLLIVPRTKQIQLPKICPGCKEINHFEHSINFDRYRTIVYIIGTSILGLFLSFILIQKGKLDLGFRVGIVLTYFAYLIGLFYYLARSVKSVKVIKAKKAVDLINNTKIFHIINFSQSAMIIGVAVAFSFVVLSVHKGFVNALGLFANGPVLMGLIATIGMGVGGIYIIDKFLFAKLDRWQKDHLIEKIKNARD